jgi:hypothetical protein
VVPFDFAADSAQTILEFESGCAKEGLGLAAGERVEEEIATHLAAEDRVDVLTVRTGEIATFVGLEKQGLVT